MYFGVVSLLVLLRLVVGDKEPNTGYNFLAASNGLLNDAQFKSIEADEDPISILARNIPGDGIPGEDFPILWYVPDTGFDCKKQSSPGYFADVDEQALCQVFHICQEDGTLDSFLCPNGSIFNQQFFVCDWWFNVDCSKSEQYFRLNENIGVIPDESRVKGRFDSSELGYKAPIVQQSRLDLESSEDSLQQVDLASIRSDSSANQFYQAPEQRKDLTITQSYLTPEQRNFVSPVLRAESLTQLYGIPTKKRRN